MRSLHGIMEGNGKRMKHFEIMSPPGIEPGAYLNMLARQGRNVDQSATNPRLSHAWQQKSVVKRIKSVALANPQLIYEFRNKNHSNSGKNEEHSKVEDEDHEDLHLDFPEKTKVSRN